MNETLPLYVAGVGVLAAAFPRLKRRLELSRAKHRSLTGHSRMAKRVARLIPYYEYDEDRFFAADGASAQSGQAGAGDQARFMAQGQLPLDALSVQVQGVGALSQPVLPE